MEADEEMLLLKAALAPPPMYNRSGSPFPIISLTMSAPPPTSAIPSRAAEKPSSPLYGSGEMADMIRNKDWSQTPLGPIREWSETLLAMVNTLLQAPNPYALYWGEGLLMLYNDVYRGFLGSKHPASLGAAAASIWQETWPYVGKSFQAAYHRGEVTTASQVLIPILFNGKMEDRWWSYSILPIYDHGQIAGVFVPATENTSVILAQQKLNESEAQASRVLESIGDAVIVTDAETRIVRMNPVAQDLTGWPEEAAIGRDLSEVFHIVNESTREPVESPADKVKRLNTVVGLDNHTILLATNGNEVHIDDSGAPIRNDAGELTGAVLVFRDIGRRRKAEKQRDALSQELSQVLEVTRDAVLSIDRQWRITYMNPNAKKAAGPLGEIGRNFWECFPDAVYQGSPYVENYHRAMDENMPADFEAFYPAPLDIWVDIGVRPTAAGISLFFRDITAAKRITAALLQSEKLVAVGRLASTIAHEINNPLEAVTNLLYLARTTDDLADVRAYLDTADLEVQRMSAIASQTLRFHKQASRPTSVTCDDLIGNVLAIHQARLTNSDIRVEKRKRAHAPVLCFDGEIRQVLSNLVGNAIDAMHGTGGRLLMRSREGTLWRTGRKGLIVTVADTGSGMCKATLEKAFGAFFTTKGIGGTGLGLWISREILDRHDGRISVRSSQKQGRSGTVFAIFLPFDAVHR